MGCVLLVEDDAGIRESLADVLEGEGHAVTLASNGQEGLERLARLTRPCLVLLDLAMPVLDGVGFLDALERRADREGVTVVLMSAHASVQALGTRPLVARALSKPFDVADVLSIASAHAGGSLG